MFRINLFKTSWEEKHVPNNVRVSVRTTPITVSQPTVFTKKDVNSDSNGLSFTGIDNTKTRRPQPRSNTKNDRVLSTSKSSCNKNKEVEVEEHHRKLLLSRNKKHMSSACNNIKLATQNVKSKVVCAMCKECLISVNHDDHLCPSCEQGKSKRASHPPKPVPNSRQRLHLLRMDLCGLMRIASINGKRANGALNLEELFAICTNLSNKVLALEIVKDAQAADIIALKARIKKLEKNGEKGGSTKELVSTARPEDSTVRPDVGTVDPIAPPVTTIIIFYDEDITMTQTLIKIKEEKAKEKEVSIKYIKDSLRPARSILTLKPLPTIDPKDKGKELKRYLEIVSEDDDDVTIKATPLSSKSPTIVDYKIYKEGKKSYFKITKANGNSQNYLTFGTMFKNFIRENLEFFRSIVKEIFKKTKPVDDMDNLLFQTLRTMFEHQVEDNIWKFQQGIVKVYNWKLFDSCGVYCVTTQSMVYYLLVKKMYPFTKNIIHQLWKDVKLQSMQRLSMKKRFRKKESVSKHRREKDKSKLTLDDSTFDGLDADLDVVHDMHYMDTDELVNEGRLNSLRPARSILTLKPLPTIDPKDKGKGVLEYPKPAKKMTRSDLDAAQITKDAEVARLVYEEELAELEREKEKRQREEEASKAAIAEMYDEVQARIEADALFRAVQRSVEIRSRPPTKSQLRNLMMTNLKNMGGYKHSQLKAKTFAEIQGLYERQNRVIDDFKPMDSDDAVDKEKVIEEPDNSDLKEEEHLKTFLQIVPDEEGEVDYEVLGKRFPIINWESKFYHLDRHGAECIYYRIFRSDGCSRWIQTFFEMVTRFDRMDLKELYSLVMQRFKTTSPEEEWILKSWNFYENYRVHTLTVEDGTVIYMLAERSKLMNLEAMMEVRIICKCWFYNHTTNGHQFTMSNRHQELASQEANGFCKELASLKQTALEDDLPDTPMEEKEELSGPWILFTDGSSCIDEPGVGLILTNPKGAEFTYALRRKEEGKSHTLQDRPCKVKFLIVAIDYFTKWIEAKPMAIITGAQIKKFMWDNIVCKFGLPREIISDDGKQFRDNPFKDWCEKLCRKCFASVKHPQVNGLVERANRSLGEGIKAQLYERSKNWMEEISHVLQAHCSMIKSSNRETPFSLTYGTEVVIPVEIGMPTLRTTKVDMIKNDEALEINLYLLEERRE
nr:reverse transcriptase domain-containing protein [Tanacetum cinerariifolium]